MNVVLKFGLAAALAAVLALPAQAQQDSRYRQRGDQQRSAQQQSQRQNQQQRARQQRSQQQRQAQQQRGRLQGEVVKSKRVDVRGTDRQHYVVLVKTERGNRVVVDLGAPSRLGRQLPNVGDQITVSGRLARIGDRRIVVGEVLQTDNRTVRIEPQFPSRDRQRQQAQGQQRRGQDQRTARQDQRQTQQQQQTGQRAALGVRMAGQTPGRGVRVTHVYRDSPADQAGLEPGDVIVMIDDRAIITPREVFAALAQMTPGQQVLITVDRDGERQRLNARLTSRQEALSSNQQRTRRR